MWSGITYSTSRTIHHFRQKHTAYANTLRAAGSSSKNSLDIFIIMNLFDSLIQFRGHQLFDSGTIIVFDSGGFQCFGRDTLELEDNAFRPDDSHDIRPALPVFVIGMYLRHRSQQTDCHAMIERLVIVKHAHTAFKR